MSEFLKTLKEKFSWAFEIIQAAAVGFAVTALLFILCLSLLTAIGSISKSTTMICLAGLIWLGAFVTAFFATSLLHGRVRDIRTTLSTATRKVKELRSGEMGSLGSLVWAVAELCVAIGERLTFSVMGVLSSTAAIVTSFHIHLAAGDLGYQFHSFVAAHPWNLRSLWLLVAPTLGMVADGQNKTKEHPGIPGESVSFLSSFGVVACAYLLVLGLWGSDAFKAARIIIETPSNGEVLGIPFPVAILSQSRQTAALTLLHVQGWLIFSILLGFYPLCSFLWGAGVGFAVLKRAAFRKLHSLGRHTVVDHRYKGAKFSGFVMGTCLLLLYGSVFVNSGAAAGTFKGAACLYFRHVGDERDKRLCQCTACFGDQSDYDRASCYQSSAAEWESIVNSETKAKERGLRGQALKAFRAEDSEWRSELTKASAGTNNRDPFSHLSGAQSRWRILRERGRYLSRH